MTSSVWKVAHDLVMAAGLAWSGKYDTGGRGGGGLSECILAASLKLICVLTENQTHHSRLSLRSCRLLSVPFFLFFMISYSVIHFYIESVCFISTLNSRHDISFFSVRSG